MADPTTRIELLETSVEGMQDELVKINAAMNDKFKFMEESFGRLMEAVNSNKESSSSAPRVSLREEVNQNTAAGVNVVTICTRTLTIMLSQTG